MKIVCELCKKVFEVKDGKVSSRGTTVYCPRCKHAHLAKRIIDPYPIDPKYRKGVQTKSNTRPLITTQGVNASISPEDGELILQRTEKPITGPSTLPGIQIFYDWKKALRDKSGKKKKSKRMGAGKMIRVFILVIILGLVALFYLYQRLSVEDQKELLKNLPWNCLKIFPGIRQS